jgi:ribosome biogenesis GTPase
MQQDMSGLGRVLAQHRGLWLVSTQEEDEPRLLPARGSLRDTPPVTGDWVEIDAGGAIAAVLERRGTLVRLAPGEATTAQVLAANVDLALVVESLPEPGERRAERLVALALAGGVPAALVLTKADLAADGQAEATRLARRLGVADGVAVSVVDGTGLGILRSLLPPGTTAALIGRSGAGKSTLVNALLGEDRQATQPVRAGDGRGRHTTVTRELIPLPWGAAIVDTPGLRSIGLWDGAGEAFGDIERLAAACRFADCRHDTEPGCAVRDAVDPERLAGWRKLQREQARLDDRKAAARARKESARRLTRQVRAKRGR